jgi:hypothetical protein
MAVQQGHPFWTWSTLQNPCPWIPKKLSSSILEVPSKSFAENIQLVWMFYALPNKANKGMTTHFIAPEEKQ